MVRPVRRGQSISPFGVGALVDFPGPTSLIHCGLDAWPFDEQNIDHLEFKIEDEKRLAKRLGVEFFVLPPDYRFNRNRHVNADTVNQQLSLPFLRFPTWHVCTICGVMYQSALHDKAAPECSGKGAGAHYSAKSVQVRFVAACQDGHLQDFPWWEWVQETSEPETDGRYLRMTTGSSASLAGIKISCYKDGKIEFTKSLAGAFNINRDGDIEETALKKLGINCAGCNPALGPESKSECDKDLQPLLRGSSNVYFPRVVSSIYVPQISITTSPEILEILENSLMWVNINMIAEMMDYKLSLKHGTTILEKFYPNSDYDVDEFTKVVNERLSEQSDEQIIDQIEDEEIAYRRTEYEFFQNNINDGYPKSNLLVESKDSSSYEAIIRKYFDQVSLIHKLRETRAFTGFSRIYPTDSLSDAERMALISSSPKKWLPAYIVRGEGIFLKFNQTVIDDWMDKFQNILEPRIEQMQRQLDIQRERRHQNPRSISPQFVMMHTLAHLLINQLVFDCGYGSASLRERIYCSDGDGPPMAGILIYTAAGDSEGSMGGLVRMGSPGRLEGVLMNALESAQWCSSDPVCIESDGQGPDNSNLAACHSCSLLPETSCEEGNRLLDRALLIGTLEKKEIGLFS